MCNFQVLVFKPRAKFWLPNHAQSDLLLQYHHAFPLGLELTCQDLDLLRLGFDDSLHTHRRDLKASCAKRKAPSKQAALASSLTPSYLLLFNFTPTRGEVLLAMALGKIQEAGCGRSGLF